MAARGCSRLLAANWRLASTMPHLLGRMNKPPKPRSALRVHAHGRDLLRAAGRNALPGLVCTLVYVFKRAAKKTADSGTSSRRHRGEVPMSRRSADGATKSSRHRRAGASTLPRLCVGTAALAPRH
jgi:hypothetical protein